MKGNYIITGDTKEHKNCLVYISGSKYEDAEKVLHHIINEEKIMKIYSNLKINFVEEKDCWWNYNCD